MPNAAFLVAQPSAPSLVPFSFQTVRLREACWMDGKPYFTRRSIGEWLGYPQPQQAIRNIIKRNPHLADPRWSRVVALTTVDGKFREAHLFDPIGLQLVVFESRQPKALEYKIAVANLVWSYMQGTLLADMAPPILQEVLRTRKHTRARMAAKRELAASHGWTLGQASRRIHRVERGLPMHARELVKAGATRFWFVHARYRSLHQVALRLRLQGLKLREISARIRVPLATVGHWTRGIAAEGTHESD